MKPVRFGTLPNGLWYYSHFDRGENVSGVGVICGSINDPRARRCTSHLGEHVVSRESMKYTGRQSDLIFRKFMGGPDDEINIRTDKISTFYGHDQLLQRHHMIKVFDVMANFLCDKMVDVVGVAIEKAAVHNEYYLRGQDSLEETVADLMYQCMYDYNPIRNRIDCELQDLQRISPKDVRQFLKKYYIPNNMFVIMFGVPHRKVEEIARSYFEKIGSGPVPELGYDYSENFPRLHGIKSLEIARPQIGQVHMAIGFPTETFDSKDAEGIDVLAKLLEMRIIWKLREGNTDFCGGAYRSPVETSRSKIHGMLCAQFATVSPEFARRAEEIVLAEAWNLKEEIKNKNDIEAIDEELEAVIGSLENPYLTAFQSMPGQLCEMVIESVCNGDRELMRLHSYRERLHKVNRKKIRELANKYFTKNYARVVVRPE